MQATRHRTFGVRGPLREALQEMKRFRLADHLLVELDGSDVSRSELLSEVDALGERLTAGFATVPAEEGIAEIEAALRAERSGA